MSGFLFIIGLLVVIFFLLRSKITLRIKIRKIIKKHPNTIRYLSKGMFKKHELIKSLKGKVFDELSNKKISVDRQRLEKIIDQEIIKVLNGWRGRLLPYLGVLGSLICIFIIAILVLPETASKSGGNEKEAFTDKSKENSNKRESKEEKKNKDEEYINSGITLMNNGQKHKAIKQLEKVSKSSERFGEAQKYIRTIKRDLFIEQCTDISYKELKKAPEDYKGEKIHLFGRIYNIQEISGKTIISLSTAHTNGDYVGDEAFILFPTGTSLVEGDYIDIYGEMKGNYSTSQQFISKYLNGKQYSIYYDQRTFFEQAPVLETRVIVDPNGQIYGK
ncbi:hypothetical protein ACIQD3_19330 [Peribacillus loiseleuriae]|uniref:hypothetical protein n=1 Tax=Peribacillus loiseleuriae TaxID=1679170 RepID=UPI003822CCF6